MKIIVSIEGDFIDEEDLRYLVEKISYHVKYTNGIESHEVEVKMTKNFCDLDMVEITTLGYVMTLVDSTGAKIIKTLCPVCAQKLMDLMDSIQQAAGVTP